MRSLILALCLACAPTKATSPAAVEPRPPPKVSSRAERAAVDRIRARVSEVDTAITDGRATPSYLVLPANADGWQPAKTKSDCEAFPDVDAPSFPQDCAEVWRSRGKVVRVKRLVQTRSGDWRREEQFTLWPDGRTAFRFQQLFAQVCVMPDEAPAPDACGEEARDYWDEQGAKVRSLVNQWQQRAGKREPAAEGLSFPGALGDEVQPGVP